jgi:hypothetical protein
MSALDAVIEALPKLSTLTIREKNKFFDYIDNGADGNCLFYSIAQALLLYSGQEVNYEKVKEGAAEYRRQVCVFYLEHLSHGPVEGEPAILEIIRNLNTAENDLEGNEDGLGLSQKSLKICENYTYADDKELAALSYLLQIELHVLNFREELDPVYHIVFSPDRQVQRTPVIIEYNGKDHYRLMLPKGFKSQIRDLPPTEPYVRPGVKMPSVRPGYKKLSGRSGIEMPSVRPGYKKLSGRSGIEMPSVRPGVKKFSRSSSSTSRDKPGYSPRTAKAIADATKDYLSHEEEWEKWPEEEEEDQEKEWEWEKWPEEEKHENPTYSPRTAKAITEAMYGLSPDDEHDLYGNPKKPGGIKKSSKRKSKSTTKRLRKGRRTRRKNRK